MQTTSHILMIRPVHFAFNAETAVNNAFQVNSSQTGVQEKALAEFDAFVRQLSLQGVDVTVVEDTPAPHTPDAIFPNNWISFHENGIVCLYPMFAANRRKERKPAVLEAVAKKFPVSRTIDLTGYEEQGVFLEGTGSMILDRDHRIAYACLSPRTDTGVLEDFCRRMGYTAMVFHSTDETGMDIYHTNVMMCVADRFVVICLDSIRNETEKKTVMQCIADTGKDMVPISLDQMKQFAGNMLQVQNTRGEPLLVMSSSAYHSLSPAQIDRLSGYNRIIHADLSTIEKNGGGSARCMMAEIMLA
jgi:hypothetical protein